MNFPLVGYIMDIIGPRSEAHINTNVTAKGVVAITNEQDRQIGSSAREGKFAFQAAQWMRLKTVPARNWTKMNLETTSQSPWSDPPCR
jgi:hypothetical protein